jgi:drug/metabolite transporter (DMT)-like permease
MIALSFAFLACLSWGGSCFLAGINSKVIPVLTLLIYSVAASLGILFLLFIIQAEPFPRDPAVYFAVLGGLGSTFGLFCFYRGLSLGAISIVVPVSGMCALLPVAVGLILGEVLNLLQGLGIVVAIGGGVLVSWEKPSAGQSNQLAKGFIPALGAALGFGTFYVMMDFAGSVDPLWAATISRLTSLVLLLPVVVIKRPPLIFKATHLPAVCAVGILEGLAAFFYTVAAAKGMLSLVSVISSLYPGVSILLAAMIIKERLRRYQFVAVIMIVLGVSLISAF